MTSTPSIDSMTPATNQPEPLCPVTGEKGITIPELEGIPSLSPDAYAVAQVISSSLSRFADRLELLHAESTLERIKMEEAAELRHHELLHAFHQCSNFLVQGHALIFSNEGQRFPSEAASLWADGVVDSAQLGTEPLFNKETLQYQSERKRLVAAREEEKMRLKGIIASKRAPK